MPPLFKPYTKKFGVACVQKSHSFNIVDKMNNNTYIPKLPLGVASLICANNCIVLEQLIELHNGYAQYNYNYNKKNGTSIKFDGYIGISQKKLSIICGMPDKAAAKCVDCLSKPYHDNNVTYDKPCITMIKGKDRTKGRRTLYKVNADVITWLLEYYNKKLLKIPKGTKKNGKYECTEEKTYAESTTTIYEENHNRLKYAYDEQPYISQMEDIIYLF